MDVGSLEPFIGFLSQCDHTEIKFLYVFFPPFLIFTVTVTHFNWHLERMAEFTIIARTMALALKAPVTKRSHQPSTHRVNSEMGME